MTVNDLDRAGMHFPLGAPLRPGDADTEVRPFGLRYSVKPDSVVDLDWDQITYDPDRQISIVTDDAGTIVPAMRHTSTKTKTSTNSDDRKPPDSDEDASGT